MTQSALSLVNEFRTALYYAAAVAIPVLHLLLAAAVLKDARAGAAHGRRPALVGAFGWAGLTLVFGLTAFALYWVVHHSTLRAGPDARS